jgi:hypothetical protein
MRIPLFNNFVIASQLRLHLCIALYTQGAHVKRSRLSLMHIFLH